MGEHRSEPPTCHQGARVTTFLEGRASQHMLIQGCFKTGRYKRLSQHEALTTEAKYIYSTSNLRSKESLKVGGLVKTGVFLTKLSSKTSEMKNFFFFSRRRMFSQDSCILPSTRAQHVAQPGLDMAPGQVEGANPIADETPGTH